jgi:hypothetical protein
MSLTIRRSVDIEDEIRKALKNYMTAYCRPLPANYSLPCILITQIGGSDVEGQVDTFNVTLDARAKEAADANETLRNALGILRKVTKEQTTPLRHIVVNSSGNWGSDPVRPDLAMYSAQISVVVHQETITI